MRRVGMSEGLVLILGKIIGSRDNDYLSFQPNNRHTSKYATIIFLQYVSIDCVLFKSLPYHALLFIC
jgi:hypothetical protein